MAQRCCPWWKAYLFDNPLRRFLYKPEILFAPYLKEGMTALDVGCGMGFNSIAMARIVGDSGMVIALDIQQKILDVMERRARKAGVFHRITPVLGTANDLEISEKVDFAVVFWTAHEIPDLSKFLDKLRACLKPEAKLLLAEPADHVTESDYRATVDLAVSAGFALIEEPKVKRSLAAVFDVVS